MKNEDSGWLHTANKDLYESLIAKLCQRSAITKLQQWSNSTPTEMKESAQLLAKAAL